MYAESAKEIVSLHKTLAAERGQWDTLWQDIANYVMPRKSQVTDKKTPDTAGYTDKIHSTEAIHDNITLAAGQLDYMVSGKWFEFVSPVKGMGSDGKNWYKACSEIVQEVLQDSNFNLEIHEFFIDRGGFGTAHIHCDDDDDDIIVFKNCEVGSYSIIENDKGIVDGIVYEMEFTAKQAVQKFGEENVHTDVLAAYNDDGNKRQETKYKFIHAIFPRTKRDIGKKDGKNKPWASIWVDLKHTHTVREGGFDEQPFCVSRFLKWSNEKYGYCPSIEALPTIKQDNFIEMKMDALAELAADPRILIPSGMEGDIDFRAGGVTVFDSSDPNAKPAEWATQGRYDVGMDRLKDKKEIIRRAYHVDLFQLLTQFDEMRRQKTAFEVSQMLAEKLTRISPTFERIKVEVFKPVLNRAFAICFRRGLFPEPPAEIRNTQPDGNVTITVPKVNYTSKLAMAIKAVENSNFLTFMQMVLPMLEIGGTKITNEINFKRVTRGLGTNQGVPSDFWNTEEEILELEEAQAAQAEAAASMEQAERTAKAAKDFGGAPEELRRRAAMES
jgi:hypothetical protein